MLAWRAFVERGGGTRLGELGEAQKWDSSESKVRCRGKESHSKRLEVEGIRREDGRRKGRRDKMHET